MNGIIALIFTVGYFAVSFMHCRKYKLQIKELSMCGIACALTIILSFIYVPLPTGAVVSLGTCVPMIVLAVLYDYRLAIIAGWVTGILCLLLVPVWHPVHWAQVFTEHLICFSCLGYAGIFGTQKKQHMLGGMFLAFAFKLTAHIISGVVFYSTNAWDGWGAWAYSISYNISYWIPEMILSAIILHFIPWKTLKIAIKK